MICTCIQGKDYGQILEILDDPWVEMAEIRLDLCTLSDEQTEELFGNTDTPLIATCRISGVGAAEAERRLGLAIRSGARFADLELEADAGFSKRFRTLCEECGTEIIRSFHDFEGTPDLSYLKQVTARCFRYGADIAKIAVFCRSEADVRTVEELYAEAAGMKEGPGRLVAFGMGDLASFTRISCLKAGAPFSYASLADGEGTAPGQMDYLSMHKAVYRSFSGFWRNDITVPASKSFAQRAIVAAALAEGRSHLYGYTPCDDSESAIAVARALGAKVRKDGTTLTIDGTGAARTKMETLHTGESGLLTRLMVPLMAVLNEGPVLITGEKTLLKRPLKGISDIMASFGVVIKDDRVPLPVCGPLISGTAEISGKGGSQLISGLLAALPLCDKPATLYVTEPRSIPYMFITCDVLKHFGVRISAEMEGDERMIAGQDWSGCTGITFKIKGGQRYRGADFDIEGDWSSAAVFLTAGAIFGKAEVSGLDTKSLQADLAIADILVQAGAVVSELDDAVCVCKAPLEAFETDLNNSPDIFPVVALLAAFCSGTSVISGAQRLAGKESDRAEAIVQMLTRMGVRASVQGDAMTVEGETLASRILNGRLLKGGDYSSYGDHRMAMVLKIASMGADGPVNIDDTACVAKSFPDFFGLFD